MSIVTAGLLIIAAAQDTEFWARHPGFTDTPWELQQPARLLAETIDGPGFYLSPLAWPRLQLFGVAVWEFGRLFGVAAFWAWMGMLIDRRVRRSPRPLIKFRLLRGALALGGVLFLAWLGEGFRYDLRHYDGWGFAVLRYAWRALGFRSGQLEDYVGLVWCVALGAYLSWTLIGAIRGNALLRASAPPR